MYVKNVKEIEARDVEEEGAYKVRIKWLIKTALAGTSGAKAFAFRYFIVDPDGYTPLHSHPEEHGVYVLTGSGFVHGRNMEREINHGDVVFIPANEIHQFKNIGTNPLTFFCIKGCKKS